MIMTFPGGCDKDVTIRPGKANTELGKMTQTNSTHLVEGHNGKRKRSEIYLQTMPEITEDEQSFIRLET
ncbi:hypothetical protein CHS0354_021912 [Potamilus streckersoni]|uniref:Uncharacterized protein n=1 Tax=Potamilus streckersoni TaxID=2493646 RepID=A0AAE0SL15_9BIVA|nr:hypothetical protein CHS0354_021912 [Potamilus streckersoni]